MVHLAIAFTFHQAALELAVTKLGLPTLGCEIPEVLGGGGKNLRTAGYEEGIKPKMGVISLWDC